MSVVLSSSSSIPDGALRVKIPRKFLPLLKPARYKALHGGRASAKSHFFAEQMVLRCFASETRAICIREVQNTLRESSWQLILDKIEQFGLGWFFKPVDGEIRALNGSRITFRGMRSFNAENIKSLEGYDIAWVEEAQTLSEASLRALRPTLRKEGSEIWFSWNPRKRDDPVDNFFRGGPKPPDSIIIEVSWRDNPWLPDVVRKELEYDRIRDPNMFAHVWDGGYLVHSEAQVFVHGRHWTVGTADEVEKASKEISRWYQGGDFGFAKDPNVLVRGGIIGRKLYIVAEVYEIGTEIDHLPFLFGGCDDATLQHLNPTAWESLTFTQKRRWAGIKDARRWPTIADSARPETISYLRRHGFPLMSGARKGAGSVEEGITFLQTYNIVVHPSCTHTIDELTHYSWKVDKKTEDILPILEDQKNHVADACRYMVEKLRRPKIGLH